VLTLVYVFFLGDINILDGVCKPTYEWVNFEGPGVSNFNPYPHIYESRHIVGKKHISRFSKKIFADSQKTSAEIFQIFFT
jgi:hypothetical protein